MMVWICLPPFYDSIRAKHVSVVFFWIKKSTHYQGAVLLPKWLAVYLHLYPQTINVKWLFVHMPGHKQSRGNCLGHVRQLGHVYCLH